MPKYIVMTQQINAPLDLVFPMFCRHRIFNTILWPLTSVVVKTAEDPNNSDGVGSIRKIGIGPLKSIQEEITKIIPNQLIEYQMLKNCLFSFHLGRLEFEEKEGISYLSYSIWLQSKIPLLAILVLAQLKWSATRGLKKVATKIDQYKPQ
ncbi:SRPBCC family protein [Acinetobacter calcoaceticus]|uniref:SRPBCC family protein n=1 Tax=Acinetobacter calcoaceticus TaxID=471 RepID=UPI002B2AF415|nr:SRPBCC family protein [Acinetobacter baumannii]